MTVITILDLASSTTDVALAFNGQAFLSGTDLAIRVQSAYSPNLVVEIPIGKLQTHSNVIAENHTIIVNATQARTDHPAFTINVAIATFELSKNQDGYTVQRTPGAAAEWGIRSVDKRTADDDTKPESVNAQLDPALRPIKKAKRSNPSAAHASSMEH